MEAEVYVTVNFECSFFAWSLSITLPCNTHTCTAFPWFRDLASKVVETLHGTNDPKSINTQALEEAIQKVCATEN